MLKDDDKKYFLCVCEFVNFIERGYFPKNKY